MKKYDMIQAINTKLGYQFCPYGFESAYNYKELKEIYNDIVVNGKIPYEYNNGYMLLYPCDKVAI